jgi:hypothetical protein
VKTQPWVQSRTTEIKIQILHGCKDEAKPDISGIRVSMTKSRLEPKREANRKS